MAQDLLTLRARQAIEDTQCPPSTQHPPSLVNAHLTNPTITQDFRPSLLRLWNESLAPASLRRALLSDRGEGNFYIWEGVSCWSTTLTPPLVFQIPLEDAPELHLKAFELTLTFQPLLDHTERAVHQTSLKCPLPPLHSTAGVSHTEQGSLTRENGVATMSHCKNCTHLG